MDAPKGSLEGSTARSAITANADSSFSRAIRTLALRVEAASLTPTARGPSIAAGACG